jgi:hypothetical protein
MTGREIDPKGDKVTFPRPGETCDGHTEPGHAFSQAIQHLGTHGLELRATRWSTPVYLTSCQGNTASLHPFGHLVVPCWI